MFKKKKEVQKCDCETLKQKVVEMEDGWKRTQADFANFKKRTEEEKKVLFNIAKAEVVLSFLPIYDSLIRASRVAKEDKNGWQSVIKMYDGILLNYQIQKIELDLNNFDPNLAEAIGFKEGKKEENGKIAEVVEMGFRCGEQVIKPARVLIYK